MKQKPNPNSKRNFGLYFYLSPELNQSIRNYAAWFNKSLSEMLNILIRLGISNAEFMVLSEKKKQDFIHLKALERLGLLDNTQNNTTKPDKREDTL